MRKTAFISYSDNDPLSRLICNKVHEVLTELDFEIDRYANERRQREWANYGANAVEASLQAAKWADVVIGVIIPTYCGWIPARAPNESPLLSKSICRMEYEAGQSAGKHVVPVIVDRKFKEELNRQSDKGADVRDIKLALLESENQWLELPAERKQVEHPCLAEFIRYAKNNPNSLSFPDIDTLVRILKKNLTAWQESRESLNQLPTTPEPGPSQKFFIEQLAKRMSRPGVIAVTGTWGVGATTAAVQAARLASTQQTPNKTVYVACRNRKAEDIRQELCHKTGISIEQLPGLGIHRNLFLLDHPAEPLCDPLPVEKATWVIVTSQRRLLRQLGIHVEDQFQVPGLSIEDGRTFLRQRLRLQADLEPEAMENLVRLLPGWPLALEAIAEAILDDMSDTPVANCVRYLQAGDYTTIISRLLKRLPGEDLRELSLLSAIPASEFSTAIAAATLGKTLNATSQVLNQFAAHSITSSTGQDRWRLEEVFRRVLNAAADWNEDRENALDRLRKYFLQRLQSETIEPQMTVVMELEIRLIFELLLPNHIKSLPEPRNVINRLIQLAKTARAWTEMEQISQQGVAVSASEYDRAFYLWNAGKAAARRQDHLRASELFQRGLGQLSGIATPLRLQILTSLGSSLANRNLHEQAVGIYQEVISLEQSSTARQHRPYITQHAMSKSLWYLGKSREAAHLLQTSIQAAQERADHEHLANAYLTWTLIHSGISDTETILQYFDRAEQESEQISDHSKRQFQICLILERRGDYLLRRNDYGNARVVLERASQLVRGLNEPEMDLRIHTGLLTVYQHLGFRADDSVDVCDYLRRERKISRRLRVLLPIIRQIQDFKHDASTDGLFNELEGIDVAALPPYQASLVLLQLGEVQSRRGQHAQSIENLKQAIQISRSDKNERGITIGILQLAKAFRACHQFEEAISHLKDRLQQPGCDQIGKARIQNLLGQLYIDIRDFDQANVALRESLQTEQELGGAISRSQAYPLHELAQVCIKRKRYQEAIELLNAALTLENRFRNPRGQMIVLHSLSRAELGARRFHDALKHIALSLDLVQKHTNPFHQCQLLRTQASILRAQGAREESRNKLRESLELADQSGMPRLVRHQILVRCELADQLHQHEADEALRLLHESLLVARNHGEFELELVVMARISRHETLENANATLEQAANDALKRLKKLRSDRALRPVLKRLIASYRQGGNDTELQKLLYQFHKTIQLLRADPVHMLRMSRLRQLVVCELARSRARQDRQPGSPASLDFLRSECESAIYDADYHSMRSILLTWCTIVANRGDVELAAITITEYFHRLKNSVPSKLMDRLLVSKAQWLVTRAKRRRCVRQSCEWKDARLACLEAIQWSRNTLPKRSEHQARMLLASLYVEVGRVRSARLLLSRWFEAASQHDNHTPLESENADRDDQRGATLDTIGIWSKIDHGEAITLLDRLIEGQRPLNVKWDWVDAATLKSRLLRDRRPYSADVTLLTAYDRACKEQNLSAQARISQERSRLLQRLQQHQPARLELERTVEHRRELGDPLMTCDALRNLCLHLRHKMNQAEPALTAAQKAMEQLNQIQNRRRVITYNSLVKLHRELGQLDEAKQHATAAIREAERWGDPRLEGSARLTFAAVLVDSQKSREGLDEYGRVIARLEHDATCNAFRYALSSRGRLNYRLRLIPEAIRDCQRFLELSDSIPFSDIEVFDVRCRLAKALRQSGFLQTSLQLVEQTLMDVGEVSTWQPQEISAGIPTEDRERLILTLRLEKGTIQIAMNQYQKALTTFETLMQERQQSRSISSEADPGALPILERMYAKTLACLGNAPRAIELWNDSRPGQADDHRNLAVWEQDGAIIQQRLGNYQEAIHHITRAEEHAMFIADPTFSASTVSSIQRRASSIELQRSRPLAALDRGKRALDAAFLAGSSSLKWKASESVARAYLALGQPDAALLIIEQAKGWVQSLVPPGIEVSAPSKEMASWLWLAWTANMAAGHDAEAQEWERLLAIEIKRHADCGVMLQFESNETNPVDALSSSSQNLTASHLPSVYSDQLTGTVTLIRDGSPSGLIVRLNDGREGFCSTAELFAGGMGNLHRRFKVHQQVAFREISEIQAHIGEVNRVPLAPRESPVSECNRLHGRTILARLLPDSMTEDGRFFFAELDSGEHLPIAFPAEAGWLPPTVCTHNEMLRIAGLSDLQEEHALAFIKVLRTDDIPSRFFGSLKAACTNVLQSLAKCREPIAGEVVLREPDAVFVRLAPGVVGVCDPDDAVTDVKQFGRVKQGDRIAVMVESVNSDTIKLSRVQALRSLLKQESRRRLLGKVIFSNPDRGTLLEFGPGLVGIGNTPTRPFANHQTVAVEVSDKLNERGGLNWHTIRSGPLDGTWLETAVPSLGCIQKEHIRLAAMEESAVLVVDSEDDSIPDTFRGKVLQDFQKEAMRAIAHRDNIILCAPTGSGKTLVADWAIERSLEQGRRAIFASPVKALSNQKYRDFRRFEKYPGQIGLVTGDVKVNPLAPVLVVTTETFRNWVIERPDSLLYFDLAIFDEVHYIDDANRGSAWEESIMYAPSEMQIIALSATIPNVRLLSKWMNVVRKRSSSVIPAVPIPRPVPLEHRFCGVSRGFQIFGDSASIPSSYLQTDGSAEIRSYKYPDEVENGRAIVPHLIEHDHLPAIYFCAERELCEIYARELAERVNLHEAHQAASAVTAFDQCLQSYGFRGSESSDKLRFMVNRGIGFHHSGLLPALKMTVEEMFEKGHIRLLYATDTFAIGVNMPARSVTFDTLNRGHGKRAARLSGRQYAQMAGRAGRLGNNRFKGDDIGTVYSLIGKNQVRLTDLSNYEKGIVEPIESHLAPSYRTMLTLFGQQRKSIDGFWQHTLAFLEEKGGNADPRYLNLIARWTFLDRIGYRTGENLSPEGNVCARLAMNNEVALTEVWSNGWFLELEPFQIVALFGCFACEKKNIRAAKSSNRVYPVKWMHRLLLRLVELRTIEAELGIPKEFQLADPQVGVAQLFANWANGMSLADALTATTPPTSAGDFINWARMAIQGLTSLLAVLPPDDPGIPRFREARTLLERDEVVWDTHQDLVRHNAE